MTMTMTMATLITTATAMITRTIRAAKIAIMSTRATARASPMP